MPTEELNERLTCVLVRARWYDVTAASAQRDPTIVKCAGCTTRGRKSDRMWLLATHDDGERSLIGVPYKIDSVGVTGEGKRVMLSTDQLNRLWDRAVGTATKEGA